MVRSNNRRRSRGLLPATVLAAWALAGSASATAAFKPRAWEITRSLRGGPGDAPPMVARACFTAAQLQADPLAPLKLQPAVRQGERAPQCAIAEAKAEKGQVVMNGACKGPFGARKIAWTGTHTAGQYDLAGKIDFGLFSARMTIAGRHTGDCAPQ